MAKQCSGCGKSLDNNVQGDICPQCVQKKQDYEQFETHRYSKDELEAIALGSYTAGYAKWGFVKAIVVIVPALLGCVGGTAVGGDFGFGAGLIVGLGVGVAIIKMVWRGSQDEKYPSLKKRLDAMYTVGALFGGGVGVLGGLTVTAAMGYLKREYGLMPFVPAAFLGALAAVCGGLLMVVLKSQKCKDSLLANFGQWEKEKSR